MNDRISWAGLLLIAVLTPGSASAGLILFSDVEVTAFGSFNTQGSPETSAFDRRILPPGSITRAEVLVFGAGLPFPSFPTTQTNAFASSAGDAAGFFGVGVSGFFFSDSLPQNALLASGTATQSVTNNSTEVRPVFANFLIPAPTIAFFGVESFSPGVDPARDVTAETSMRLVTKLTRTDGSTVETVHLDYGMASVRSPILGGFLTAQPSPDAGRVTRTEGDDGSIVFELPELQATGFPLPSIGPGETLEYTYEYFAQASTGFGETGVFAAIGDPFNLDIGAGRFEFQVEDSVNPVPEPRTLATFGLGLVVLGISARRGRRPTTAKPRKGPPSAKPMSQYSHPTS